VNPISWSIDEHTIVRTLTLEDAEVIFRAIDANRDRLRPYMPWERTTRSPDDVRAFIERSLASPTDEDANGIWVAEEFAGNVGLRVDTEMNTGEIGYWNVRSFEGRGLITEACRRFVEHGFRERMLHRIEIHAAVDNLRSRSVAERLGFTLEGTMRDGHRKPDDTYVDQVVYGLLESDRLET
jgi:ribosomal-protein-serine acetyltransferase